MDAAKKAAVIASVMMSSMVASGARPGEPGARQRGSDAGTAVSGTIRLRPMRV
ncbi:hypothetical protein [Azospirillum argentinense]